MKMAVMGVKVDTCGVSDLTPLMGVKVDTPSRIIYIILLGEFFSSEKNTIKIYSRTRTRSLRLRKE